MNNLFKILPFLLIPVLYSCQNNNLLNCNSTNINANIFPDYTNITIPNNIAPLNFMVQQPFTGLYVTVENSETKITKQFKNNKLMFKNRQWKKLVKNSINDTLWYTVFVSDSSGKTFSCKPFYQFVSDHKIDPYIAYRQINTGYVMWEKLGIYQRNIENFKQSAIIENTSINTACINCHSFNNQNPARMMLHVRKNFGGTTILHDNNFIKVNTKTKHTLSAGVYPAWHPSGKIIAYSTNIIGQQFHANYNKRINVTDQASDIILYDIEKNIVTTCPQLCTPNRENLPSWSPDGKYLYYISAPQQKVKSPPVGTVDLYSLLRIPYNAQTNQWGKADTLIAADTLTGSISFPKPSPCGKYIVFTKSKSGYFTIHYHDADLYLLNLETGEISKPDINSNSVDSYHSWNSTGRWMVFSSKRIDKLFTRPYFTHFSSNGTFSKPFVLPQQNPDFYNSFLFNYNIPEFITGKVKANAKRWRDAIRSQNIDARFDSNVDINAISGATAKNN